MRNSQHLHADVSDDPALGGCLRAPRWALLGPIGNGRALTLTDTAWTSPQIRAARLLRARPSRRARLDLDRRPSRFDSPPRPAPGSD